MLVQMITAPSFGYPGTAQSAWRTVTVRDARITLGCDALQPVAPECILWVCGCGSRATRIAY